MFLKIIAAFAVVSLGFIVSAPSVGAESPSQPTLHPCTAPNYVSSSPSASVTYGSKTVNADVWNDESDSTTLYACSAKSWYSVSSSPNDGKSVQSYPDTQEQFSDPTVESIPDLESNFAYETSACNKGDAWETAYDIYLGGPTSWANAPEHTEMMIWGTNCNQSLGETEVATDVPISGYTFDIYESGAFGDSQGVFLIYLATSSITSGTYDLSDFFNDAANRGYLSDGTSTHLWAVDNGGEFCQGSNVTIGLEAFSAKEV